MDKKGSSIRYTPGELMLAGILVFGILFGTVMMIGNPTKLNQRFIAKDSATIVDTLFGTPIDSKTDILYPNRFPRYYFEVRDNLVIVSKSGVLDLWGKPLYPFMHQADYPILVGAFFFTSLEFNKERNGISFRRQETGPEAIPIDDVDTSGNIDEKRIYIESDAETAKVADLLRSMVFIESTASKQATTENADLVVSIRANEDNVLRIYYADADAASAQESKKLAQLLYNEFVLKQYFQFQEIKQPPNHEDRFSVFGKPMPAVQIELGTDGQVAYAEAIIVAIRNYYQR